MDARARLIVMAAFRRGCAVQDGYKRTMAVPFKIELKICG